MERTRREDFVALANPHVLRSFVRVVEVGSVTRAAESLFLAQSAVSGHLATLASVAGGSLVERRAGRLEPTRLGRQLHDGAVEILSRYAELERRLRAIGEDSARSIAVACTRTVCETSVARVVGSFKRACPEYRLDVRSGTIKDAETRLRSGEIEVALLEGEVEISGARTLPFHHDRLRLAVPAGHPLARRRRVPLADAARYPFLLRTRASGTRILLEQRLGSRFERLAIAMELEGNDEIVSCVEAGIGLAFLSESAMQRSLALHTIVAVEIDDVDLTRDFSVAFAEGRELGVAAQRFVDWLVVDYVAERRAALTA